MSARDEHLLALREYEAAADEFLRVQLQLKAASKRFDAAGRNLGRAERADRS